MQLVGEEEQVLQVGLQAMQFPETIKYEPVHAPQELFPENRYC